MSQFSVFYSWQSDLPNRINRNFIGDALEKATKQIKRDDEYLVEPVIDRDTLGKAGAPNIAETILNKIEQAQVFVCDISIINSQFESKIRQTPNPNVLFELGYAYKILGEERIILVMNTTFGGPEKLPFDLKMNRVITYNLLDSNEESLREKIKRFLSVTSEQTREDKQKTKKGLVGILKKAIEAIIAEHGIRSIEGYLVADQKLFNRIRELLPRDGVIRFMRSFDYGAAFQRDIHKDIWNFVSEFEYPDPDNEFHDQNLEELLKILIPKITEFNGALGQFTFPERHNPDWNRIDKVTHLDYQLAAESNSDEKNKKLEERVQRNKQIRDNINTLAQEVCDAYDDFVRLGRKTLAL